MAGARPGRSTPARQSLTRSVSHVTVHVKCNPCYGLRRSKELAARARCATSAGSTRGWYMGLNNMSWQVGFIVGPALGGVVLALEPLALWLLCALACLAAGLYAVSLEGTNPDDLRRTPIPKGATG